MSTLTNTPTQITRELPDGGQVEITHAHGRTYLRIKPKGARSWCSAPVDLESAEILAGRWALMNSVERAARAAKQREADMLADLVCLGIALLPQIGLLFWSPAPARVVVGGRR